MSVSDREGDRRRPSVGVGRTSPKRTTGVGSPVSCVLVPGVGLHVEKNGLLRGCEGRPVDWE